MVPWHCACAFAFHPRFLGHKPCQAAPTRVREQARLLSLTYSLCPGTGAGLFSPATLEDCGGHTEAMYRIVMPLLRRSYAGKTPSRS